MNNIFLWLCFGVMWLMVFGVVLYYIGMIDRKYIRHTLVLGIITILSTTVFWLAMGYSLSFYGNIQYSIFSELILPDEVVSLVLQLLFCLYAVIMLVGSVLERSNWKYIALYVPLWILFIYAPVCYSLWGEQSWLSDIGVLDYSGGLVVHATAGIGSLVLARTLPIRSKITESSDVQEIMAFIGMVFITLGWFGFNMAPSGEMGEEAIRIWLNTLISIIGGGISWFLIQRVLEQQISIFDLTNGMIVGLVGSTCSVAYVGPGSSLLISIIVCIACPIVIERIHQHFPNFDDAGDSFGMNAIGGIIGSILTGILAENGHLFNQLVGTFFVCLWSFGLSFLIHYFLRKLINDFDVQYVSKNNETEYISSTEVKR